MAEMIVGLSKSNAEMRTTIQYLDQIQRSTERLGRVRYQSLIKVNNELRTTGRRLESIYSTAVRISRLRITPTIGLIDKLSPALDRALVKLNSFRNQMVKASGTVSVEVKQKVEVAMGKMSPASGPSLSLNIGSNNNTVKNAPKEEEISWIREMAQKSNDFLDPLNNATDLLGKLGSGVKFFYEKIKGKSSSSNTSQCCCCSGGSLVGRISKGRAKGGKTKNAGGGNAKTVAATEGGKKGPYKSGSRSYQERAPGTVKTSASDRAKKIITNMPHAEEKKLKMDFDQKLNPNRHGFSANLPGSPMSNMFSGNGMFGKLSGGLAKGAGKLLGPISMLADVANVATASPEQRGRAVGSMIGGTAGTAIGSAIGSFILPGIGTYIGGALGGWAGSSAGGWIGDKAKDIGNFMSNATEGAGKALSTAADFVSEKTKNIASGISNFFSFGSKKEEKTVSATTAVANPTPVPSGPSMPPAYIPSVLTTTGPMAYANSNGGQSTTAALLGTSVMQSQAMGLGNGAQTAGNANGKSSTMTVQISEDQMSSLSGYLKDFKTETTNQISVNVPQGAVQVTVRENAIDYDAISHQVGMRFAGEVRRAMENRKTIMA
ncbi:hypothetical protein PTQ21_11315 [Paenibacillus marchantiae]|uniref:hypothetical protein n=1 Tax=Paenibacillus TaxID=44249 RepID=UPI0022A95239|nr:MULTISPECIES: hypothetical protein [Paenibacillus]MCZ1263414.1 hypothetical protein [Paenibacillus tundrae]WDQ34793.1 hypothetical protein PTQ21_11315 [Paenibacillus marchantiae]